MLTGEFLPADKHASAAANHADETGPDAPHLVLLGTSVVRGTGTAIAMANGPHTLFSVHVPGLIPPPFRR